VFSNINLLSASGIYGVGEAPQLSPKYGQYDDGAKVFNYYWNFAGTTLPSGWSSEKSSDGTLIVNNGVTLGSSTSASPSYAYIVNFNVKTAGIAEINFIGGTDPGGYGGVGAEIGYNIGTTVNTSAQHFGTQVGGDINSGSGYETYMLYNGSTAIYNSQTGGANWKNQILSSGNNPIYFWSNYSAKRTSTSNNSPLYPMIDITSFGSKATNTRSASFSFNWFRIRSLMPNNIMPSVSIGYAVVVGSSVQQTTAYINATVSYYTSSTSSLTTQTNSTTVTYTIKQGQIGIYFNATFFFSLKLVSSSLYVNATHPISWKINVSHLLNLYYSAPYNTFTYYVSFSNYSSTSSSNVITTLGTNTKQYWDFILFANWTNTNGKYITVSVLTTEAANYYPNIIYKNVKWTGVGSTELLTVNATNMFPNETLQVANINWGDGSPTTSTNIYTVNNYYNFTITHSYLATGTFTITFQVVNMVNVAGSLSVTAKVSITLTITITTAPSSSQPILSNSYLYFNWTSQNIAIQKIVVKINNIQAKIFTLNNLTSGSVSYLQSQTAQFNVTWIYYAGNYKNSITITYVIKGSVPTVGKWVIVNYTLQISGTTFNESVPYFYTQTIPYNTTWSYFVWQISLPANAVNITVKGNPAWKYPTISVPANYNATTATFKLLVNVSTFQVTWLAKNPVYNALMIIEYYPQTAIFGQFGITLPFSAFYTYLNGQQIYSPTQIVNLGETVVINTTTIYHTLLSSYKVTITQTTQFVEIPLNILPLTIENLNSSYVIGLSVEQNNITQQAQFIMPLQTVVFYVPAGTYNFTFNYIQFNTYTIVKSFTTTITVSSVSYYLINGITLSQLSLSIQESQNNITNLVESVNITFLIANSKIANQIINLNLNLSNINASISKQEININNTVNNILSKVISLQNMINIIENNIMSNINKTSLNVTTKILTIKSLLLTAMNLSIQYKLTPGISYPNGSYVDIPIYVSTLSGMPLNLSMTEKIVKNLNVRYISPEQEYNLSWSVIKVMAGEFILQLSINNTMKSYLNTGNALIILYSMINMGNYTTEAAGVISNSNALRTATIVIEYYPQNAVFGEFGVTIPFSDFYTYINGKQIYSPIQTVNISSTIIINTTTIYHTLISSYKVTITQPMQFIEIPINILPITIENLNSSYVIGLTVSSNGITQQAPYIMPLQTVTFYIPAGTYLFTFNYIQFNTYTVVKSYSIIMNVSTVSYYLIQGVTLSQLSLSIQKAQNNITSLVENVNISILNSNSNISNQIVNLKVDLSNVNSTINKEQIYISAIINNTLTNITKQIMNLKINLTNINSTLLQQMQYINNTANNIISKITNQIMNLKLNLTNINSTLLQQEIIINSTVSNILSKIISVQNMINIIENNVLSNINKTSLNVTTKILTVKSLLLLALNSSVQYKLTPGAIYANGTYIDIPVYVSTLNGAPLSLAMTTANARNIYAQYISPQGEYILNIRIIKIQPGLFVIQLDMNDTMKREVSSGNATITLTSPIKTNNYTTEAAGVITSSNFPKSIAQVNYLTLLFTTSFSILNLWWLILFIIIVMLYFVLRYQNQVSRIRPSLGSLAMGGWVFAAGIWLILFYSEPLIMTNTFNIFNAVIYGISPFILFTILYLVEFIFVIHYARKVKKPSRATIALGLWTLGFLVLYILLFLHLGGVI
jgi:hypothetical protein